MNQIKEKTMNKLLILALCVLMGCAKVVIDTSSKDKGGGTGGEGGETTTETTSSSEGGGGEGGIETTTSSAGVGGFMTTSTETFVCEAGPKECKEGTCFCPSDHACCNDPINYTMCAGNENGYCCPLDMFCIPKE